MNRRTFFRRLFGSITGGALLSHGINCNYFGDKEKYRLRFSGDIVGEDVELGHKLRDGYFRRFEGNSNNKVYPIIIAGMGCSGLTSAWELTRNGFNDYLIVEKEAKPGGISLGDAALGTRFTWGAHYVDIPPLEAKYLHKMFESFGIITDYDINGWPIVKEEYILKKPTVNLYVDNEWVNSRYPKNIAGDDDIDSIRAFYSIIKYYSDYADEDDLPAFTYSIEYTTPKSEIRDLDKISLYDFIIARGLTSKLLHWYLDVIMQDNFGTNIKETSAWVGIHYFCINFYRQGNTDKYGRFMDDLLTWPEGNNFLVNKLLQPVPKENQLYNHMIVNVEKNDNVKNLTVTMYDKLNDRLIKYKTRVLIYALPKYLIPYTIPEMKKAGHYACNSYEYCPWLVANLHVERPPEIEGIPIAWDNIQYDTWHLGYVIPAFQKVQEDIKGKETILSFYAALANNFHSERFRLLSNDWNYWAQKIVGALEQMHPGFTKIIRRLDIMKWGHAMVRPYPGFVWGSQRKEMKQTFNNIIFSHSDNGGIPVFEEASYIGLESVYKALDILDLSYDRII